jgi:hypothetical protein
MRETSISLTAETQRTQRKKIKQRDKIEDLTQSTQRRHKVHRGNVRLAAPFPPAAGSGQGDAESGERTRQC